MNYKKEAKRKNEGKVIVPNGKIGKDDRIQFIFTQLTSTCNEENFDTLLELIDELGLELKLEPSIANQVVRNCFEIINSGQLDFLYKVLSVASYAFQFTETPQELFQQLQIWNTFKNVLNPTIGIPFLLKIIDFIDYFLEKISKYDISVQWLEEAFFIFHKFSILDDVNFFQLRSTFLELTSKIIPKALLTEDQVHEGYSFYFSNLEHFNPNFDFVYVFSSIYSLLSKYPFLYETFINLHHFEITFSLFTSSNPELVTKCISIFTPIVSNDIIIEYFIQNHFISIVVQQIRYCINDVKAKLIKFTYELAEVSPILSQEVIDTELLKIADLYVNNFELEVYTLRLVRCVLTRQQLPPDEYIYNYSLMKSIAFLSTDDPTIIADSAKIIMMLHTQIKQISDETTQEIVEEAEALRNNEAQDVAEAMDELIAVLCTDEETDF